MEAARLKHETGLRTGNQAEIKNVRARKTRKNARRYSTQLGVTTCPRVMFVASNETWSTLHRRTCFIPRMTINHGEFNELQHAAHNNTHISGEFTRAYCIPLPAMRLVFITRRAAGSFFCDF